MGRIIAAIVIVYLLAGCLDAGRMASQESIKQFAERQIETVKKIVAVSRATPLPPELVPLIDQVDDDAYQIKQWTRLTQADLGRANPEDIELDVESQASLRAMYERETKIRNMAKAAARKAGLPVTVPNEEGGGMNLDAETAAKFVGGPIAAIAIGWYTRHQKKKRKDAEAETKAANDRRDRAKRAAREAIQVIGQSQDTKIRETAALKKHLLEEFAEAKQEEYAERARAIDNGSISAPQAAVETMPIPGPGNSGPRT